MQFALFITLFVLVSTVLGAPRPQSPANNERLDAYKQHYRDWLYLLELYGEQPWIKAPVSVDPHSVRRFQMYLHHLSNHDAYIHPKPDQAIQSATRTLRTIADKPNPSHAEQQYILSLFEAFARQSKNRLQGALHPINVRAQHKTALDSHQKQLEKLIDVIGNNAEKLTSHLDTQEQARMVNAQEILDAEIEMLGQAKKLASKIPQL